MGRNRTLGLREFFEDRYTVTGDGCWTWTGAKGAQTERAYARGMPASRVAWELYMGPIPEGLQVNHVCDNPLCVCPYHLYIGTQADNNRDMRARHPSFRHGKMHTQQNRGQSMRRYQRKAAGKVFIYAFLSLSSMCHLLSFNHLEWEGEVFTPKEQDLIERLKERLHNEGELCRQLGQRLCK